jgi:hypothetical protein
LAAAAPQPGLAARPGGLRPGLALPLPGLKGFERRLERVRARICAYPPAGRLALGFMLLACFAVVVFATAGPSTLVPQSHEVFPGWEAGPVSGLFGHLTRSTTALDLGLSAVAVAMLAAYLVALASVRHLSMRLIAAFVVAVQAVLVLSPPQQLTDLFNYLGYARLGGLHGLNPYTHVIAAEMHDPIYRFATWYHLPSPYGPLFTVLSYPVSLLSLPVAYWTLKVATVLASLAFVALVYKCAKLLGRDPRFAVLFVAANPIYLMYAISGFHNDFFMLVPSTAAVALLLARRDRSAGAVLMLAVAVKFTSIILLPFLLVAARPHVRRRHLLSGAVAAGLPLVAMHLAFFGLSLPNLADQSTLLTPFSIPNLVGTIAGVGGGTPGLLRFANVALVVCIALLLRRRRDWLADAGWSTLALIFSLAWLVPWYVVWLLPLAALARNLRLRQVALAFTLYLVLAFMPATGMLLSRIGVNLMSGSAGQASRVLQQKLER